MKATKIFFPLVMMMLVAAVAGCGSASQSYDAEVCRELAVRVDRRDSLSQDDYATMIAQNEAILKYLIEENKEIAGLPEDERWRAWRDLLAEPEYMERFGYMFTLGSALYQADERGALDKSNARRYAALDSYNEELASYSDR